MEKPPNTQADRLQFAFLNFFLVPKLTTAIQIGTGFGAKTAEYALDFGDLLRAARPMTRQRPKLVFVDPIRYDNSA